MKRLAKSARPVESSDSDEEKKKTKNKSVIKKTATSSAATSVAAKSSGSGKGSFLSLEASMNDITLQVFKNDAFVCIRDKYPKGI